MNSTFLNQISVGVGQMLMCALGALMVCLCVAVGLAAARLQQASSQQAFVAKDVVAVILPPPLYLIELRSIAARGPYRLEVADSRRERRVRHFRVRPTDYPAAVEPFMVLKAKRLSTPSCIPTL